MENNAKGSLGLLDATMVVVGSMIGSGIFIVSAEMTRYLGSSGYLLLAWALTGVLTLIAALSYGELSAMFPKAGGQYVYLREAYNPLVGFLYGWSFFAVIQTGTIAAVGVAFSKFAAYLFPILSEKNILFEIGSFGVSAAQLVGVATILILTYLNTKGVENAKLVQTTVTIAKLASLFGLLVLGFLLGAKTGVWENNLTNMWYPQSMQMKNGTLETLPISGWAIIPAMAVAMVGSIFSADAWNNVTFIAGEIRNPQKNIGLSLLFGTLIVSIIYILMNVMYISVLPLQEIATAESDRVAIAASQGIWGQMGVYAIAVMIMVSTFGCNNGLILAGARVYRTMALDGLFFKKAGDVNKNQVPEFALWIQCAWACVLCLSGKYGALLDYVVFVVLLFYALTIGGIFILRKNRPDAERPYKAWGYPVIPLLYIIAAISLSVLLFIYKFDNTWPGLGIILVGIPIYYAVIQNKKSDTMKNEA